MPYLIVEYDHDPPVTDEELVAASQALEGCLGVRGVKRLRSWVSQDRRRGICEYHAANADVVREAYRVANVRFARVWTGTLFAPGELPDDGAS